MVEAGSIPYRLIGFAGDGTFIKVWETSCCVGGIAVGPSKDVHVTRRGSSVKGHNASGDFLFQWGYREGGEGWFFDNLGIAIGGRYHAEVS